MREVRTAIEQLARKRAHRLDDRATARYLVTLSGHPTADILRAIDAAGRESRLFPSPQEILRRLPPRVRTGGPDDPPPATAAERAQVRQLATRFLARYGLEPAPIAGGTP